MTTTHNNQPDDVDDEEDDDDDRMRMRTTDPTILCSDCSSQTATAAALEILRDDE
jgi:hypothetical protein